MHSHLALAPRRSLLCAALLAVIAPAGAQAPAVTPAATPAATAPAAPTPAGVADEAGSYSIGLILGGQLHSAGLEKSVALDSLTRGFRDGLGGKQAAAEDRDRAVQMTRAARDAVADRNHGLATEFLAKNGSAPGVKTTESGLQYQIISEGDTHGASPKPTDRVTVHYRGRLLDGTEFDNSDHHPQSPTFVLNSVIKGWREALQLMKPGAQWRLFVPPALAYDLSPPPGSPIPPGSLLVFDVELVKIEAPETMKLQPKPARPAGNVKPAAPKVP